MALFLIRVLLQILCPFYSMLVQKVHALKNTQLLTKESDFYPSNKCLMRRERAPTATHIHGERCAHVYEKPEASYSQRKRDYRNQFSSKP